MRLIGLVVRGDGSLPSFSRRGNKGDASKHGGKLHIAMN